MDPDTRLALAVWLGWCAALAALAWGYRVLWGD